MRTTSACLPTIMWKAKGTDSVLFSISFSPEDKEETKERTQSCEYKEEAVFRRNVSMMRANSDQYSTPHLKTPVFLRVILGADNGPALYGSHTRGGCCVLTVCVQL